MSDEVENTELQELARQRQEIDLQIKMLEGVKKELTSEIINKMHSLGASRVRPDKDGAGYVLQRPTKTLWNENLLRESLLASAPKVAKKVFKRTVTYKFDEEELSKAIDKGDVPDAHDLLSNQQLVEIVEMAPRLMPLRPRTTDS